MHPRTHTHVYSQIHSRSLYIGPSEYLFTRPLLPLSNGAAAFPTQVVPLKAPLDESEAECRVWKAQFRNLGSRNGDANRVHCLVAPLDKPQQNVRFCWSYANLPLLILQHWYAMAAIEATCPVPSDVLTGAWQQTKAPQQVFTNWNVNRVGCFDAHRTKCPYSAEVTMQTHLYKSWIAMKLWSSLDDAIHSNQFCSSQQYTTAMNYSCQFFPATFHRCCPHILRKKPRLLQSCKKIAHEL